jgi:hypothetical protein
LDVLNGTAEFVEEYAKELQAIVLPNDPQLKRIFCECALILSDLQRLVVLIEDDGGSDDADATKLSTSSLNEEVMDMRSRLMSLQFNLSHIHNKKLAKDADAIKEAVTELLNGPAHADDSSSIRIFYTSSSIPYVERQMWRELERSLRGRFTAEFVRDNYILIVATVEDTMWENTTPGPVDTTIPALAVPMASALTNTTMPTLHGPDRSSALVGDIGEGVVGITLAERRSEPVQTEQKLPIAQCLMPKAGLRIADAATDDNDLASQTGPGQTLEKRTSEFLAYPRLKRSASMTGQYGDQPDTSGRTWASSFDDSWGERLLTFGS